VLWTADSLATTTRTAQTYASRNGRLTVVLYVRYESAVPNAQGEHTGIFGLANVLARSGQLSPTDWTWWRRNNDWLDAAYPDPATTDPTLFDRRVHPTVSCWFKSTAIHLLARVPGYLDLLDRYSLSWRLRRTTTPGKILYDDPVQIVASTRA
jgi:hypothetical protein